VTTVSTLPTHVLEPHTILYGFSVMIKKQFFAYFSSFPRRSNISIRKTLEKIRKSYSFSENDLKREITLTKNLLRKESKLRISLEQFLSFIDNALKKLRLIVTGSCNSSHHQRFMREKFFKSEITEKISQKLHDQ